MLVSKHLEVKDVLLTRVRGALFTSMFLIQAYFLFPDSLYGIHCFFPLYSVPEECKEQELCTVLYALGAAKVRDAACAMGAKPEGSLKSSLRYLHCDLCVGCAFSQ